VLKVGGILEGPFVVAPCGGFVNTRSGDYGRGGLRMT